TEPAVGWRSMVTGEGGLGHTNAALTTNSARRRRIGPGDAGIQRFLLRPAHLDRACARGPRTFHDKFTSWGEYLMNGLRYDRILAGTALALILAIPMGGLLAQDPNKIGPAPTAAAPVEQTAAPAPAAAAPAAAAPAEEVATPALAAEPVAVAEQAVPADPLASLDPADRAIAEKMRDLLAATSDKIFVSKKERAAAEAFYQSRNFLPLWLDKGVENAHATSAIARLKHADADGLEVSDYKTPNFAGLGSDALAEAELKLTQAVLTYARHVQAGRFPYTRVSRNIELPQAVPETADVLGTIAAASDAGKALDTFSPQHQEYQKLKAMLAELRANSGGKKSEAPRQI